MWVTFCLWLVSEEPSTVDEMWRLFTTFLAVLEETLGLGRAVRLAPSLKMPLALVVES